MDDRFPVYVRVSRFCGVLAVTTRICLVLRERSRTSGSPDLTRRQLIIRSMIWTWPLIPASLIDQKVALNISDLQGGGRGEGVFSTSCSISFFYFSFVSGFLLYFHPFFLEPPLPSQIFVSLWHHWSITFQVCFTSVWPISLPSFFTFSPTFSLLICIVSHFFNSLSNLTPPSPSNFSLPLSRPFSAHHPPFNYLCLSKGS